MNENGISAEMRRMIRARAGGICEYCLVEEAGMPFRFHIDHVIAEKHDGPSLDHNLCLCCPDCNRAKGSDISTQVNGRLVRLYNPRIDDWSRHFVLDNGLIRSRSLIGAATLKLLDINDEQRLARRRILQLAGRYPNEAARMIIARRSL